MKILAIGAHPDDIEIFMFGFLCVCLENNYKVHTIVATDGASGTVLKNADIVKIRKNETTKALRCFGKPDFLQLPDGKLFSKTETVDILKKKFQNYKPDLIITHAPEDYHPDHVALSQFVENAASFNYPVIFCETLLGIKFEPDYYVNISKYFINKKKAILMHKSQTPEKFCQAIEITNRFRAAQCNAKKNQFAEVFRFNKKFPFADFGSLLPQAMRINPYYKNLSDSLI